MEVICKTTQIWPILNCLPSQGNGWGGRDEEKLEVNVLGTTVEYCSCYLEIRNTGMWGIESYLALQDKREDGSKEREG